MPWAPASRFPVADDLAVPEGPKENAFQIHEDDMSKNLYLIISGAIFLLVGIFHLLRLVYQWPIVVGTQMIPQSLSYVGFPVATGYAVWAYWLLRR